MYAGTAKPLPNFSLAIMDALFAPFPEAAFPKLSVPCLISLLESPLATSVPLPMSTYQSVHQLYPDLFTVESTVSAPQLATTLVAAVQARWPTGPATEFLYTPFWDKVSYGLPELIGRQLGLNVSESRCVDLCLCVVEQCEVEQHSARTKRMLASPQLTSDASTCNIWTM